MPTINASTHYSSNGVGSGDEVNKSPIIKNNHSRNNYKKQNTEEDKGMKSKDTTFYP
jgi:hypothetical protein